MHSLLGLLVVKVYLEKMINQLPSDSSLVPTRRCHELEIKLINVCDQAEDFGASFGSRTLAKEVPSMSEIKTLLLLQRECRSRV